MSAPQASLMKMLIEGVMSENLPWTLIFIGVFIAVTVELLGIPVLPVAIGLYLPLELSSTIMLGSIVRAAADWYCKKKGRHELICLFAYCQKFSEKGARLICF